jgi:hypothetical protein
MTFDPKKLRKDAQRLQGDRPEVTVGRESIGTTRAIREALPDIYKLRKDGLSWPAIAGALAIQGVVQGKDRIPLTTNRLTAIVSQLEEQERKKASKVSSRAIRSDAPNHPTEPARRFSLSSDLISRPASSAPNPSSTEEELRHAALKNIQNLLKKE